MSHTKEPWIAVGAWVENPDDDAPDICTCDPAAMDQEHFGQSYKKTCANARRIAACVNACAGIPTELLEDTKCWAEAGIESATSLRKQRDKLLAALEGLHKVCEIALAGKDGQQHTYFETRAGHFVEASGAIQTAEAAITRVKGDALPC